MAGPLDILLAEDNPADVRLIEEGLEEVNFPNRLHVVNDGERALAFLRREGDYEDAPRPDFVLIDLMLPKVSGRELLAEIKNDPDLLGIPVLVLASLLDETNVSEIYNLSANACIAKPRDLEGFITLMENLKGFWLNLAILPSK